jgi:putative ABC transport system substrate-binding protein
MIDATAGVHRGLGAAACPRAARAQQPAMPVVGLLVITSPGASAPLVAAFRQGLSLSGYVEGRNVAIDFRSAEGQYDRLPALAADLVRRQVSVIFTNGGPVAVRAATAQTATIPIVFAMGEDPVKEGLVASLNRPGGNVTGFVNLANQLNSKRLSLLRDTVPRSKVFAYLVNSTHPNAETEIKEAQAAAAAMGLELLVFTASTERAVESAFAAMVQQRLGGLSVSRDPSFIDWREQLAALAARLRIPAIYDRRDSGGWRSDELWHKRHGRLASERRLQRPHPRGRETGRSAGPAIHQV